MRKQVDYINAGKLIHTKIMETSMKYRQGIANIQIKIAFRNQYA